MYVSESYFFLRHVSESYFFLRHVSESYSRKILCKTQKILCKRRIFFSEIFIFGLSEIFEKIFSSLFSLYLTVCVHDTSIA